MFVVYLSVSFLPVCLFVSNLKSAHLRINPSAGPFACLSSNHSNTFTLRCVTDQSLISQNGHFYFTKKKERYKSSVFKVNMGVKGVAVCDKKGIQALFDVNTVSTDRWGTEPATLCVRPTGYFWKSCVFESASKTTNVIW